MVTAQCDYARDSIAGVVCFAARYNLLPMNMAGPAKEKGCPAIPCVPYLAA